jgi:beta-1,4-mannooligosaccharide phosphorylase
MTTNKRTGRRHFLALAGAGLVRTRTGYGPEAFDSKTVDYPFVFFHDGQFYMTYVGYDGIGYQTGLASSKDLINWKKLDCILKRDPSSPVTRYNVAMNWPLPSQHASPCEPHLLLTQHRCCCQNRSMPPALPAVFRRKIRTCPSIWR